MKVLLGYHIPAVILGPTYHRDIDGRSKLSSYVLIMSLSWLGVSYYTSLYVSNSFLQHSSFIHGIIVLLIAIHHVTHPTLF